MTGIKLENTCVLTIANSKGGSGKSTTASMLARALAEKNYKVVEKFREKKFQDYQIEAMNEEQKLLDEIGLQIYTKDK